LRESAGLSRLELAQRAGIGVSTLYLIEDGLVDSRFSTLMRIAFALNVTPDRLLGLSSRVA
jgi:transcriptional regulator with XRE-family HTH domain